MAKPELIDHRKFLKLRRLLNAPTPHVLGYLECLWRRGYQTGDSLIGDADDVEAAAEFPGDRGAFAKAAHEAGFLDKDEEGSFSIHDLYEHAPGYAKKRMHRVGTAPEDVEWKSISDGETLHGSPNGRNKRKTASKRTTKTKDEILKPKTENQRPTPLPPAEVVRADAGHTETPKPKTEEVSRSKPEDFDPMKRDEEAKKAFVEQWNAAGLSPIKHLNASLQGRLFANLLDSWWREEYPAAIARAGTIPFLRDGTGRHNGKLDPMEFLKEPDLARQINAGKFDPRRASTPPPGKETAEERNARVRAEEGISE